jgi:hypothetical protein
MDAMVLERERAREANFGVGVGAAARAQAISALPESLCGGGELDGAAGAALKRGG